MNRILFMDDDANRHKIFKRMMAAQGDYDITYTWNADETIEKMKTEKFDLWCLDHDLSVEDQMCDPNNSKEKNGSFVATWVRDNIHEDHKPHMVILHSFNRVGALNMGKILHECGIKAMYKPFGL